jgi:predicted nuclease of predicted toxin-antitoxin system
MSIRLIADENISWRIKKLIPQWDILPANKIKPGKRLADSIIWKFAKENQYGILTFDEDFSELQNLFSFPPKIIWLRTGNISTQEICDRLISLENEIISFQENDEAGIYEIYIKK